MFVQCVKCGRHESAKRKRLEEWGWKEHEIEAANPELLRRQYGPNVQTADWVWTCPACSE